MLPDLMALLVLALACWHVVHLLQWERGPWGLLAWHRKLWGVEHDEESYPRSWPNTEAGRLLRCVRCASLWPAGVLAGAYLLWPIPTVAAALPFALSALAIGFQELTNGQS